MFLVWEFLPLDLSSVTGRTLAWQEGQRAMARRLELSVRHRWRFEGWESVVVVNLKIQRLKLRKKARSFHLCACTDACRNVGAWHGRGRQSLPEAEVFNLAFFFAATTRHLRYVLCIPSAHQCAADCASSSPDKQFLSTSFSVNCYRLPMAAANNPRWPLGLPIPPAQRHPSADAALGRCNLFLQPACEGDGEV